MAFTWGACKTRFYIGGHVKLGFTGGACKTQVNFFFVSKMWPTWAENRHKPCNYVNFFLVPGPYGSGKTTLANFHIFTWVLHGGACKTRFYMGACKTRLHRGGHVKPR